MGSPRWLPRDIGGELFVYAPVRPDAGPTVEIRNRSATVIAAGTAATLESINTTIAQGAEAGAQQLELSASQTLRHRGLYIVGGVRPEVVQVKSYSGVSVQLQNELCYGHAGGVAFQSSRISYTVSAATATPLGDHWQAVFSYAVSAVAQPPITEEFAIALHHFQNPCTPWSMRRIEPQLVHHLSANADWDEICDRAFETVCDRLTARGIPIYDYIGSSRLERACSYMGVYLCAETYGQDFKAERDLFAKRAEAELSLFAATSPADEDRDGVVSAHEGSGRTSLRIRRTS